ncbi:MAG: hypothetical protein Q4D38_01575 [Planctomycetia bacterium]|nr:hypothetical protein [Planctomycetia bacterium]
MSREYADVLGLSVGIIPLGKADVEKQEEFVAEYRQLRENTDENEVFYFGDGCHPRHNSLPAYGWIRRGEGR